MSALQSCEQVVLCIHGVEFVGALPPRNQKWNDYMGPVSLLTQQAFPDPSNMPANFGMALTMATSALMHHSLTWDSDPKVLSSLTDAPPPRSTLSEAYVRSDSHPLSESSLSSTPDSNLSGSPFSSLCSLTLTASPDLTAPVRSSPEHYNNHRWHMAMGNPWCDGDPEMVATYTNAFEHSQIMALDGEFVTVRRGRGVLLYCTGEEFNLLTCCLIGDSPASESEPGVLYILDPTPGKSDVDLCIASFELVNVQEGFAHAEDLSETLRLTDPYQIVNLTPSALAYLWERGVTDGLFHNQAKRIVLGIDPFLTAGDPATGQLAALLMDHRRSFLFQARHPPTMCLRAINHFLTSPMRAAMLRMVIAAGRQVPNLPALYSRDRHTFFSQTILAYATPKTSVLSPTDHAQLDSLMKENASLILTNQHLHTECVSVNARVQDVNEEVRTLKSKLHDNLAINVGAICNTSVGKYVDAHTCINVHEHTWLTLQGLDASAIAGILAKRSSTKTELLGLFETRIRLGMGAELEERTRELTEDAKQSKDTILTLRSLREDDEIKLAGARTLLDIADADRERLHDLLNSTNHRVQALELMCEQHKTTLTHVSALNRHLAMTSKPARTAPPQDALRLDTAQAMQHCENLVNAFENVPLSRAPTEYVPPTAAELLD